MNIPTDIIKAQEEIISLRQQLAEAQGFDNKVAAEYLRRWKSTSAQLLAQSAMVEKLRRALTLWTEFCGRENDEFYVRLTGEAEPAFDATVEALALQPDQSLYERVVNSLGEVHDAMKRYEMAVDDSPTEKHRKMIDRLTQLLTEMGRNTI